MYMTRKIDKFLTDWKSEQDRKPLIVKGSRQVGKTESIRHFATDNYDSYNLLYLLYFMFHCFFIIAIAHGIFPSTISKVTSYPPLIKNAS